MPEIIEIDGDIVRHVRREVISTTTLAAAAPHLEVRAPSIYPIQPRGAILPAFDPDENRGAVLVERPPERTAITVHFDRGMTAATPQVDYDRAVANGTGRTAQFEIQLPYLYFLYGFKLGTRPAGYGVEMADFTIDTTYLYMLPAPLTSADTKLYMATLLNVKNARICWGYTTHDNDSLAGRINHMLNEFSVTVFNNHYGVPLPRGVRSLTQWEEESANDPMYYRNWEHWNRPADAKSAADLLRWAMSPREETHADYTQLPAPAEYGNILIPEPPRQFTIARLREWINEIPAPLRARFLTEAAAAATELHTTPEEVYEAWRAEQLAAQEQPANDEDEDFDDFEDDEDEDDG